MGRTCLSAHFGEYLFAVVCKPTKTNYVHYSCYQSQLERLSLDSHLLITGMHLFHVLATIASLRYISICGHDRSQGALTLKALKLLKHSKSIKEMDLYDQPLYSKEADAVSEWNGGIRVTVGSTHKYKSTDRYSWFNGKRAD